MQRVEGDRMYRVRVSQLLQHIVTQLKDFLMWTIFKIFNEFVTILLLFVCLFWPQDMWNLSSPTRD